MKKTTHLWKQFKQVGQSYALACLFPLALSAKSFDQKAPSLSQLPSDCLGSICLGLEPRDIVPLMRCDKRLQSLRLLKASELTFSKFRRSRLLSPLAEASLHKHEKAFAEASPDAAAQLAGLNTTLILDSKLGNSRKQAHYLVRYLSYAAQSFVGPQGRLRLVLPGQASTLELPQSVQGIEAVFQYVFAHAPMAHQPPERKLLAKLFDYLPRPQTESQEEGSSPSLSIVLIGTLPSKQERAAIAALIAERLSRPDPTGQNRILLMVPLVDDPALNHFLDYLARDNFNVKIASTATIAQHGPKSVIARSFLEPGELP